MGSPENDGPGSRMGHIPELAPECLRRLLTVEPEDYLRRGPARATFSTTLPGGQAVVVKRYSRPRPAEGMRRLMHGQRPLLPGLQEDHNLRRLRSSGVSVPLPLGCHAKGSESLVVMERLPSLVSLRELLTGQPSQAGKLYPAVLDLVLRFHGAGWYHRDLYLDHLVLTGEDQRLVLIDLERARQDPFPRRRWFIKDLAALWSSLPRGVPSSWALRFLVSWLDAHGVHGRCRRRRWLRAIRAKEARMARHTPRGGTSYPQSP